MSSLTLLPEVSSNYSDCLKPQDCLTADTLGPRLCELWRDLGTEYDLEKEAPLAATEAAAAPASGDFVDLAWSSDGVADAAEEEARILDDLLRLGLELGDLEDVFGNTEIDHTTSRGKQQIEDNEEEEEEEEEEVVEEEEQEEQEAVICGVSSEVGAGADEAQEGVVSDAQDSRGDDDKDLLLDADLQDALLAFPEIDFLEEQEADEDDNDDDDDDFSSSWTSSTALHLEENHSVPSPLTVDSDLAAAAAAGTATSIAACPAYGEAVPDDAGGGSGQTSSVAFPAYREAAPVDAGEGHLGSSSVEDAVVDTSDFFPTIDSDPTTPAAAIAIAGTVPCPEYGGVALVDTGGGQVGRSVVGAVVGTSTSSSPYACPGYREAAPVDARGGRGQDSSSLEDAVVVSTSFPAAVECCAATDTAVIREGGGGGGGCCDRGGICNNDPDIADIEFHDDNEIRADSELLRDGNTNTLPASIAAKTDRSPPPPPPGGVPTRLLDAIDLWESAHGDGVSSEDPPAAGSDDHSSSAAKKSARSGKKKVSVGGLKKKKNEFGKRRRSSGGGNAPAPGGILKDATGGKGKVDPLTALKDVRRLSRKPLIVQWLRSDGCASDEEAEAALSKAVGSLSSIASYWGSGGG